MPKKGRHVANHPVRRAETGYFSRSDLFCQMPLQSGGRSGTRGGAGFGRNARHFLFVPKRRFVKLGAMKPALLPPVFAATD
jgi:hypothetical protein